MKRYSLVFILFTTFACSLSAQNSVKAILGTGYVSSFAYYNPGYAINGTVLYSLSDRHELSLSTGYAHWTERGIRDLSLSMVPLLFGVRTYFLTGALSSYGSVELGGYYGSYSYRDYIIDSQSASAYRVVATDVIKNVNEFQIGFALGLGLLSELSSNIYFDANIKFNWSNHSASVQTNYPSVSVNYTALSAGIILGL